MLRLLPILALLTLLLACSETPSSQRPSPSADAPYNAVATTGMIGDIVSAVAGDRATVTILIGPGTDPHIYVPSRNDLARLSDADIVFKNGLHLEGRMSDILERLSSSRPVHAITDIIPSDSLLLEVDGEATDPHVWMDVSKWMRATDAVATALSEYDPPSADLYNKNAEAYRAQLTELHDYAQRTLSTVPRESRILITAHDAFQYMAASYDFEVRGIQGISTSSEAGLLDINRLVDLIVERRITAVFPESTVADRNVRALVEGAGARGHQVTIGPYLFSDAMGTPGTYEGTYIGMIDHNVTSIARFLGGDAPERGLHGKLSNR